MIISFGAGWICLGEIAPWGSTPRIGYAQDPFFYISDHVEAGKGGKIFYYMTTPKKFLNDKHIIRDLSSIFWEETWDLNVLDIKKLKCLAFNQLVIFERKNKTSCPCGQSNGETFVGRDTNAIQRGVNG